MISINNLSLYFGGQDIFSDISFMINKGDKIGLVGKNGAGKSTAINMMTGMLPPTSGNGYIFENSLVNSSLRIRQDVGLCPQENIFWNKFSVYNHLYYYAAMNGVPISDIHSHVMTLIDLLGLKLFKDIACGYLSGGNKRKVMLATSLIGGSRVLFFDEPTAGVDPVARKKGLKVVEKYKSERPIVLTTHIMEECEEICDKVGIMVNGDFVIHGTLLDLVRNANAFYQIDLNVKAIGEEESKKIAMEAKSTLKNAFVSTECITENKFVLTYRVYRYDLKKLSELFEFMNKFAETWNVEYFVSEIDTEQLFLLYTAEQRPDDIQTDIYM
jgi:ABC-type multidrug transport system ATPase subunit